MTETEAINIQSVALHLGAYLVGFLFLFGAYHQKKNGWTFGLAGKGVFYEKDEPALFIALYWGRITIGSCLLIAGIFIPW